MAFSALGNVLGERSEQGVSPPADTDGTGQFSNETHLADDLIPYSRDRSRASVMYDLPENDTSVSNIMPGTVGHLLNSSLNQTMSLTESANQTMFLEISTANPNLFLDGLTDQSLSLNASLDNSSVYWCQNESALPQDEDFYQFYETAQFVTGLILYPCVCLPGLMGNILTLIVLSNRNMRTSTNAFLSALAVADSIKLTNDLLYFCTIVLLRTNDVVGNRAYGYLYPYAHFIFSMSVCVSSWLTVSVAVERYIMVCHPTRARHVCSRGRAVAVCSAVFVVMTTLALPSALRYKTVHCVRRDTHVTMLQVELTDMWRNETFVLAYNWTQNLLRSIIPLIVLVVLNTCIIGALRKTRANKKKKKNNGSRHRVTVMMIIVILAFLVCITPDAIMSTVFGLGYTEASNLVKGIREFTDTLLAINAACNFVIYCLFNRLFLDGCKSLFCSRGSHAKSWNKELDESQYKRLSDGQGHNHHHHHRHKQAHKLQQKDTEEEVEGNQTESQTVDKSGSSRSQSNNNCSPSSL